MDKKPVLLVLALALVLVLYVGFMATAPAVTTGPEAVGEVKLEVTGGPGPLSSSTDGQVKLVVI